MTGVVLLASVYSETLGRLLSPSREVRIENPSTLELALIALATLGIYSLGKKWRQRRRHAGLQIVRLPEASDQQPDEARPPRRRAA